MAQGMETAAGVHRQERGSGFTLIEVMISITILLVGVMTAAAVMVTTEQNAVFSEQRYQDYADFRNRVEDYKAQISLTYPTGVYLAGGVVQAGNTSGNSFGKNVTVAGDACSVKLEQGAAGLPNLVRVEMTVPSKAGSKPVQVVTYVRVSENRSVE